MPSLLDVLRETGRSIPKVGLATGLAGVRLGTGMAQGLSGLYDLASPGTGNSRVTKGLKNFAQNTDQTAVANDVNPAYRIMQAAMTPASFFLPGGAAKAAGIAPKLTGTIPKITDAAESLAGGNVAQRVIGAGMQGLQPANALNAAYGTATDLGRMSGDGQQITAKNSGLAAALNMMTPFALPAFGQGAVEGLKVAPGAIRTAVQAGAKVANVKPYARISDAEIAAARKVQDVREGYGDSMQLTEQDRMLHNSFLSKAKLSPEDVTGQLKILKDRTDYSNTKIRRQGNTSEAIKSAKEAITTKRNAHR